MNKEEMIEAIRKEQSKWVDKQYAGKDKNKRQEKGQFFTPPELCYKLLEPLIKGNKHDVNNSGLVDPMAGSGNLLAAAIVTGVRKPEEVFANELDPEIYKVLKERLTSLGVPEKNIYNEDALDENLYNKIKKQTDFIDVVANPDFKLGNKATSEAIKHLGPTGRLDKKTYRAMNSMRHSKPLFNVKYDYYGGPFDGQVIDDIRDDFDEETANEYSELLDSEGEISAVEYLRQKDPENPIVKNLIGQIKNPGSFAEESDFPEEWEPYKVEKHGKFAQVNPRLKDLSLDEIKRLEMIDGIINKERNEDPKTFGNLPKDRAIKFINNLKGSYLDFDKLPEDVKDEVFGKYYKWVDSDIDNWFDFLDNEIESKPEEFVNSSSPEIAEEAQQIVNNDDKRDDEVNNANVEKALRKTIPGSEPDPLGVNISNEERANWNGGKDRAVGDATLSEMNNALASRTLPVKPETEMLDRAQPKGMLGAGMLYSRDNNIPKPSEERPLDANSLEQITESNPEAVQEALPNTPIAEEARQITDDSDARNDEVNNQAAEETVSRLSDDFETVDDLYNYLETVNGMGWNNGRVDDVDLNGPDFPVDNNVYAKDEDFVGPDEVVDYGLNDQNQYPAGIGNLDETVAQENVPDVNENDFVKSDVLPSADNVLELKPEEQEVVTEAIEENVPEEKKETYFGMLGIPHRQLGSFSPRPVNTNNDQYKLDRLRNAGASSLGRLGGFSVGSGSVSPGISSTSVSKPRAMTEHISSRVGGGNIPKSPNAAANAQVGSRAGNSNNGFITSNGGNISSGPVQKRSSLKSPKPTQLPNFTGHTAPIQTNQLGSAEDLHEALIERIKGMLDNLDPETRKKLGFSPTLYNYNGTPLNKLDGATLVQLSEMLEDMQNG